MSRANNFNFLRLLLATLVLLSHSPELIDGNRQREILTQLFHTLSFGELAVNGFFLLSGYLIVQSWQHNPHPGMYLRNRCLRIYPAFIIASLFSVFIAGPLGTHDPAAYVAAFNPLGFLKGIAILNIRGIPDVFIGTHYPLVNSPMWTIIYEFGCYLIVLIAGLAGMFKRPYLWLLLGCATAIAFALPIHISLQQSLPSFIQLSQCLRLFSYFAAGGCFFLFKDHIRYHTNGALLSFILLMIGMSFPALVNPAVMIFGGYLLFWIAFTPLPLLRNFGHTHDISYGVYLYGWPVQKLLLWYGLTTSPWLLFLYSCLITFCLASVSWRYIERPSLRFKAYPGEPEKTGC